MLIFFTHSKVCSSSQKNKTLQTIKIGKGTQQKWTQQISNPIIFLKFSGTLVDLKNHSKLKVIHAWYNNASFSFLFKCPHQCGPQLGSTIVFSWGGAVLIHDHTTVGWVYWFTLPSLAHKVAATRKTPLPTSTVSATAASAAITKIAAYQKGPRGFRPFIDKLVCTIWIQQHHKLWQISILQSGFLCNEQDKHTDFKSVIEHSILNHDFIQLQREHEALHSADLIFLLHSWIWHRLPKTWIAHVRGQLFRFININSLEVFCLPNDWTSEVRWNIN